MIKLQHAAQNHSPHSPVYWLGNTQGNTVWAGVKHWIASTVHTILHITD